MIQTIEITSREQWLAARKQDVTASAAGSLLGIHEYLTAFELWGIKTGKISEDGDNPAMRRGRLLEPVAAQIITEDNPDWKVWNPKHYLRDTETRMGATPDLYVDCPERGPGIIQVKTTADLIFKQKWRDPDTHELILPLWIAVQAMQEQHLSGRAWAQVALLVVGMGLDLYQINVPFKLAVLDRVKDEVGKFWKICESGERMAPDYARDGEALKKIYWKDDGAQIDLSGDNFVKAAVEDKVRLREEIKSREALMTEAENKIKDKMGNAAVASCGPYTLTWKTQNVSGYTVKPGTKRPLLVK